MPYFTLGVHFFYTVSSFPGITFALTALWAVFAGQASGYPQGRRL